MRLRLRRLKPVPLDLETLHHTHQQLIQERERLERELLALRIRKAYQARQKQYSHN